MHRRKPPLPPRNNPFKQVNRTKRLPDTEAFFVSREARRLDGETLPSRNLNLHRRSARCVLESCE